MDGQFPILNADAISQNHKNTLIISRLGIFLRKVSFSDSSDSGNRSLSRILEVPAL